MNINLDKNQIERFSRQIVLKNIGSLGQKKIIGAKVLIIEDVITTGKSALECLKIVKNYKADVVGYSCLIDRSNEKSLIKDKIISQIKLSINTYTESNLPPELKKIEAIKPGSRNQSK